MGSSGFQFHVGNTLKGLETYSNRMLGGLSLYGETVAQKLAAYAKDNKPWENHTSNAMQSIQGKSYMKGLSLVIELNGGMDYSPYLELAMDKKYAILEPTLRKHQDEILSGIKHIVR